MTELKERQAKTVRTLGGNSKMRLMSEDSIVVANPKTKKTSVEKITNVIDNPANTNFIRRNVITKGAIVETKLGKVKVTSRPGQEATLSGVLVE
jgi:small subunit ribosomal protein S8e